MTSGPPPSNLAAAADDALREQRAGNLDAATAMWRRILEADPAHHLALHCLGIIAYRRKDYPVAAGWISRAIEANPRESNYHNTLGACRRAMGMPQEAVASYRRALELRPGNADAHANLGNALRELCRYDEAIASYRRSLALKADHSAHLGLGNVLREAGRPRAALEHYRAALALKPDHPETHFAYSIALLACGELAEGWREYEWRHESHARPLGVFREFSRPKWDGEPLEGRRILLHAEQGYGDTLQFIRYAPLVAQRGGRVILECRPELIRLLGRVEGIAEVAERGKALPGFDLHHALLSLPLLFRTTLDSIPARVPYIGGEANAVAAWQARLSGHRGLKVGITWSGSPTSPANHRKACPLARFAPLAQPGVQLYSLQKGPASAQAAEPATGVTVTDWSEELTDFADTAALVENLDLVIAVDTAVAHLAGALGRPVWLLLNSEGDWRWLTEREDSPWYPTLRIFRQRRPGDWEDVLARVAAALRQLVARPTPR